MTNPIIELIEDGSDILTKNKFKDRYDLNENDIVDNTEKLGGLLPEDYARRNGNPNELFEVSSAASGDNDAVSKLYADNNYKTSDERIDVNSGYALSGGGSFKLDGSLNSMSEISHNVGSGYNHIPAGGGADQVLIWSEDGNATWVDNVFASNNSEIEITTDSILDGGGTFTINQENNSSINISHKDEAGYRHIPAGGAINQVLKYDGDGVAKWDNEGVANDSTVSITAGSGINGGGSFTTNQDTDSSFSINHNTGSGYNHIPTGGSSGQILKWIANGSAAWGENGDAVISVIAGDKLYGGGSFTTDQSTNGSITIDHESGAGSNHIPIGGASGQILKWAGNGEAVWANESGGGGGSANDATITLTAGTSLTGGGSFTTDQAAAGNITFNHETGSGNNHVPSGGLIGDYLVHNATNNSGVAQWQVATGFMDRSDKDEIVRGVKEFYNATSNEPSILVTNNEGSIIKAEAEYGYSSKLILATDVNNDGNKKGGLLLSSGFLSGPSYVMGLDGNGGARSWIEMPTNGQSKIALKALAVTAHSTAKAYYSGLTDASFVPSQYNVTHIAEIDDSGEYFYDLTINSMHPISYSPNGYPKVMASAMGIKTSDSKPCIGYTIHDPSKNDQNTGSTVRFKFYDDSGVVIRVAALSIVIFATTA